MGRSNREQALQNRQRIVEEADAVIRSGGVASLSIADLMARAGLTQGGFYNHFASRDALVAEACSSGFARAALNWKATAGRSRVGALKRLVRYYFGKKPAELSCPMVALGQDAMPHHATAEFHHAYQHGVEQLFAAFRDAARDDPGCRLSEDQLTAAFAAMVGANLLSRATGDAKWTRKVEQTLMPADQD